MIHNLKANLFPAHLKTSTFYRNISWNIFGNAGGKVLGPVFQLLIARLLLPADFGAFAIAIAWLAAFEIAKDLGLTQAIVVIRGGKREIALQFTVQLATAAIFYAVTLAASPFVARHFALPELRYVLPISGLIAFISAIADPIVTDCLMNQHYRRLAVRQMLTPVVNGCVGLVLAYRGYGVYALAIAAVAAQASGAILLAAGSGRRFDRTFDLALLRSLMSVGTHVVLQRFFGFLVGQADSFIVGRALGSQPLGLYRMANILSFLAPSASVAQAQQVVFTELSANPSDAAFVRKYNLFTNIGGWALFCYSIAVYTLSPYLVPVLMGPQWRETVPLLQIFSVIVITGYLTPLNMDLAKILGFADAYTWFAAVRSMGTVAAIVAAARYSTLHVVITWVVVGFAANLANDVIFYSRQNVVRLNAGKIAIVGASWLWAAFVIIRAAR